MRRYAEGYAEGADGTRIHYNISGPEHPDAPDVVLCDGIGCDGFVWKYLLPELRARHRVIRWHYRGHGRSAIPEDLDRLHMDDIIDDLQRVLDAAESKDAIFAGHSVGVQVILEAHRRMPERVLALVPICGSYGHPLETFHDSPYLKQTFPWVYKALSGLPEAAVRVWQMLLPSRLAWYSAFVAGEVNRSLMKWEDMQPYFDHLGTMRPEVFVSMLNHVSKHDAEDHLPDIDVPTLVIGAELDTFTPVWLAERMAREITGAEVLIIPKGSHAAPIEQPELLWLRLEKFFKERLGFDESAPLEAPAPAEQKVAKKTAKKAAKKTSTKKKAAKKAAKKTSPKKKAAQKTAAKKTAQKKTAPARAGSRLGHDPFAPSERE